VIAEGAVTAAERASAVASDCRCGDRDSGPACSRCRRGCRACNLGYIGLEVGLQRVQVRAQRRQSRLLRLRAGLLRLQVRWQRLQSRPQARRGLGQETAQSKDARPHAARSAQKSKHDRREVSDRSQDEPKQAPPPTGQPTVVTGAIPLSANVRRAPGRRCCKIAFTPNRLVLTQRRGQC